MLCPLLGSPVQETWAYRSKDRVRASEIKNLEENEERLRQLGLYHLEKRGLRGILSKPIDN